MKPAREPGIAQLAEQLRAGEMSPVALAQRVLARIEAHDGAVHAFIHVDPQTLLRDASAAEAEIARGAWRGPMHGIPIAIKDNIDVAGMRTTCHSAILRDAPPAQADADVVAQLRAAGAVVVGKTALHEFAIGGPTNELPWPAARNPWNLALHPGGSSSGSAAAVAAGFVPGAVGTDTSGSVRNPATCCGIVSIKPTYDLVSRRGVFPLAFSLDHIGPMARDALDCAHLLDAMIDPAHAHAHAGANARAAREGAERGIAGMRIGVVEHLHTEDAKAHPSIVAGFEAAVAKLRELGADVRTARLAPLDQWNACCRVIQQAEQYAVHEKWLQSRPGDYCEISRRKLLAGAFVPARDYIRAMQARAVLCRGFAETLRSFDALVLPSALEPPCELDDAHAVAATYERHLRAPFSVTGTPAMAMPVGLGEDGVPLGVQLAGGAWQEPVLFRIAAAFGHSTSCFA
ncbi:MAG TPA: amidase [Ramlibacter sp.]|uniref:amidase n=1 Tax=Ramlibacter sp. TaxID=1917967 RepID=UPI002BE0656D|nr:amidase [Ramlibacter sp.]HVZ43555.1 amidase [Ramlibacter sp.]